MCRSDSTSSLDGRDLELPFKRPWPPRGHSLERSAASRTSMGPLRSSTGATTLLSAALLACPGCLCSRASSHPLAVTLSPPCCRLSGTGHEVSAWLAERLTTILGGIDGFSVYCTRCCVVPLRARRQCVSLAARVCRYQLPGRTPYGLPGPQIVPRWRLMCKWGVAVWRGGRPHPCDEL